MLYLIIYGVRTPINANTDPNARLTPFRYLVFHRLVKPADKKNFPVRVFDLFEKTRHKINQTSIKKTVLNGQTREPVFWHDFCHGLYDIKSLDC